MAAIKYIIILAFVIGLHTTVLSQQNPVPKPVTQDQPAPFKATLNLDPIYKVDSVEMSREEFERAVALGNIESIQVMNDPKVTALYGDQARNGVIIIITKDRPSFAEEFLSRKKRIYPAID